MQWGGVNAVGWGKCNVKCDATPMRGLSVVRIYLMCCNYILCKPNDSKYYLKYSGKPTCIVAVFRPNFCNAEYFIVN